MSNVSKITKKRIIQGSRRSPRVVHIATKSTPEFDALLRQQAHHEGYSLAEMLEKYQEAFIWKKEWEKKNKEDLKNKP